MEKKQIVQKHAEKKQQFSTMFTSELYNTIYVIK